MPQRHDILIVGPAWVGDMVMAQALLQRLHERFPEAAIDVVAPGWSLPLLQRMPEVREGIELAVAHGEFGFGKRRALGRALRDRRYARAIVLPGSWKSALVPFFARVPRRIGFRRELRYGLLNDLRPLDRGQLRSTVQQFLALAEDAPQAPAVERPQPHLRSDAQRAQELIGRLGLDAGRPAVALMPGAEYGPAKRWPPAAFAELARTLAAQGRQVWIFGSAKERELGQAIAGDQPCVHDLCGRTQLVDVVDLLSRCEAAVTNDSGLMHVAAAVGTPLVAIYGSSSPEMTPPLTERAQIVWHHLSCSPCFQRQCPLGHLNCLHGIGVGEVLERLARL
jgi:heptosyltransferase-2